MSCDNRTCPGCPFGEPIKAGESMEIEDGDTKIVINNPGSAGIYCIEKGEIIETNS